MTQKITLLTFIIGLLVIGFNTNLSAKRIKTTINPLQTTNRNIDDYMVINNDETDSLFQQISFYGFDKPLSSTIETFFLQNRSENTIKKVVMEMEYFTIDSLQLHKRMVEIDCDVPPQETRKIDIKSWDKQKSYYFHQSVKPRRQATPFKVIFNPKICYILKQTDKKTD